MRHGKQDAKQRRRKPGTPRRTRIAKVITGGTTRKLAVSLEKGLADEVEAAAARDSGGNVSAWVAEAARERLGVRRRREAMKAALDAYEAEHEVITEAEMEEVRKEWPLD